MDQYPKVFSGLIRPFFCVFFKYKRDNLFIFELIEGHIGIINVKDGEKMAGQIGDYLGKKINGELAQDIKLFRKIFLRDSILRVREFYAGGDIGKNCAAFYFDGMVSAAMINDSVVRPMVNAHIILEDTVTDTDGIADTVMRRVLYANEISKTDDLGEMLRAVLYGDTVLLIDGSCEALTINTKGWQMRSISEPEDERILEGPREGFSEAVMINLSLLRRKLQTPDLCIEQMRIGRRSDTKVYVCYLGALASRKTVKRLKLRLSEIDIDGILDVNYINELVTEKNSALFRNTGSTERPDVVAARLLEGRVAIFVDGTPMVLTLPYLFAENFQSDEDYYQSYMVSSVGRVLRYICFFLSISVPAIYVALTVFHRRLLPTSFLLSVAQARQGVPLPSVLECFLLIVVFEILKEAGVRTQQSLGQALSIVGGLVVGQAAVEAKLVSAPMLIAVALSGIAGLMIPRLRGAVFYLRIALLAGSACLGLFGYAAVLSAVLVRIFSLRSFGSDATPALAVPSAQRLKDTVVRANMRMMYKRPPFNKNIYRMKRKGRE